MYKRLLPFLFLLFFLGFSGPTGVLAQEEPGEESGTVMEQISDAFTPEVAQLNPSSGEARPEQNELLLEVRTLRPGFQSARESLKETYADFLQREPLGFGLDLVDKLFSQGQEIFTSLQESIQAPSSIDIWEVFILGSALVILFLFVLGFVFLERHAVRWSYRAQAKLHFDSSFLITAGLRKAILIAGRVAPFPLLILLSFFPVRATFGARDWTLFLTASIVIFLIYRGASSAIAVFLRLNPPNTGTRGDWRKIETFLFLGLRLYLVFSLLLAGLDHFGFLDDLQAFISLVYRLAIALLPGYLFFIREHLFALLPRNPSSRFFQIISSTVTRYFSVLLSLTIVLLLFNAAGYEYAAYFLLTRGYAVLLVGILWFGILSAIQQTVQKRIEEAKEAGETPSPLLSSLQDWVFLLGTLFLLYSGLRYLGLYEPITAILKVPFLAVGRIEISVFNLLNVALIIAATILSIRLFKALLNAKIYPAFRVEIGTAYAFNTLINYALVVVGFVLCLVALGVHLSAVMVVFASLGVGIGFGLQNIAENLISGFILLFGRAVKKGDFITVNEIYGRVDAVGARSVVVRTPDNFSMLIPSKEIVSGRIINWTYHDSLVRIHIPIGVSYSSDVNQVREILLQTATRHPDILPEPSPDVWITDFGDNAVKFELLVYFDCRNTNERTLKGKFNFILWEALQEAGVGIPFPQRDLHIRSIDETVAFPPSYKRPSPETKRSTVARQEENQAGEGEEAKG